LFSLVFAEVFAFLLVAASNIIQHTSIRFISALLFFGNFLALHSRVCLCLHNLPLKLSVEVFPSLTAPTFCSSILHEYFYAQTFGSLPHLIFTNATFPTIIEILSVLLNMVSLDIITFALREIVPVYIETNWILFYHCLLSTIWVLSTMQLNYSMLIIVYKAIGMHLPLEYRHVHPTLSTSLYEFWGIRWNPIVGKALQESFYKPFRRLGCSRVCCVLLCFVGSGLLHCIPQYISTRNVSDCTMMFSFFFIHGVLLLIESSFCQLCTLGFNYFYEPYTPHLSGRSDKLKLTTCNAIISPHSVKSLSHQWLPETATFIFLLGSPFIIFTHPPSSSIPTASSAVFIISIGVVALTSFIFTQNELLELRHGKHQQHLDPQQQEATAQNLYHQQQSNFIALALAVLGWVWTVFSVLVTAPLFVIPAMHAFHELFPHSFLVGPLIKAYF